MLPKIKTPRPPLPLKCICQQSFEDVSIEYAPVLVSTDVLRSRLSSGGEVVVIPGAESLGQGRLEDPVGSHLSGERELDGLTEDFVRCRHVVVRRTSTRKVRLEFWGHDARALITGALVRLK
jgi:hypothetical protein